MNTKKHLPRNNDSIESWTYCYRFRLDKLVINKSSLNFIWELSNSEDVKQPAIKTIKTFKRLLIFTDSFKIMLCNFYYTKNNHKISLQIYGNMKKVTVILI